MAGSTYGTLFRITTWGESHGPAIGVVIDGCPSGLSLSEEDIQKAFEEVLPKALKVTQKKPNQTAANFLQTAMAMVNERYKDIVYLSVNENRRKGNPKTAINFNFKIH